MNRYRYIRGERGQTLKEVSEGSGVSERTLARIETGRHEPSMVVAGKLAKHYKLPLAELLGVDAPDMKAAA